MTPAKAGFDVRPFDDRQLLEELLTHRWVEGSLMVLGKPVYPGEVDALAAYKDGSLAGVATWCLRDGLPCLLTLNNITTHPGIGVALVDGMIELMRARDLPALRAIVTNDNVDGLRFYQRRGFRIVAVYPGSIDNSRKIKPAIPKTGLHGIPYRDEIELEMPLEPRPA